MTILARVFVAILMTATLCAHRTPACSCVSRPQVPGTCSELKATEASFLGTVIDIENPPDERLGADERGLSRYRFRVDEDISGFDEKEIDVYSGRGTADCSYHFQMGQSYFVTPYKGTPQELARYGAKREKLMVSFCSETQGAASAATLLAQLRALKRGSTIEGMLRTKQDPKDYDHGMPNIIVELRGHEGTFSTRTDIDGVYRFAGISPGEYHIAVKLPPNFPHLPNTPNDNSSSITVSAKDCYVKNINALRVDRIGP
jgi:hypothetical protein